MSRWGSGALGDRSAATGRGAVACRSSRPARRTERGAAAIEAALVVCFVVLPLVFGIIGYAFMLSFRQSVAQAATEGARAAAVAPKWTGTQEAINKTAVQNAVNAALTNGVTCDLTNGALKRGATTVGVCTMTDTTSGASAFKTIKIDYDYKANPLLPIPGLGIVMPKRLMYSATAEVTK